MVDYRKRIHFVVASLFCLVIMSGTASASAEFDMATRLAMIGDYDGALREYEAFIDRNARHELAPLAAVAVGNIHLEVREDYDAAIKSFDVVLKDYRSSSWAPEAARRKADAVQALERWRPAGEAYEVALNLVGKQDNPPSSQWINEVTGAAADCFYRAGDRERVIQTYEKVLSGSPQAEAAATALFRMGEAYEELEQPEKAAQSYVRAIDQYPGGSREVRQGVLGKRDLIDQHEKINWKPYELNAEATQLIDQRNFPAAREKCVEIEACCKNPRLLECIEYRKITLDAALAGDYTSAYHRMEAYLEKYPKAQLLPTAERTLAMWGQIVELEAQVQEDPGDVLALNGLGGWLIQAGSMEAAVRTLEKAHEIEPDHPEVNQRLGYAYNLSGQSEKAAEAFERYLSANPTDTNALNTVGYAYLGMNQPEEAVSYFRKYVELAPEEANAHDSLGEGLMRSGHLEESAGEYEKAVDLDPNFSNSYLMLGQVYQQMEKKEKATRAYERFLELIPSGPQADQAKAGLNQMRGEQP